MACSHVENGTFSPANSLNHVYKEDCTQCFDSRDDPHGIDVCLSCFNAGCQTQDKGHKHAIDHFEFSQHPLILNIKRLKKVKERKEGSPTKIAKLRIEAETEEDLYDIETTVKCLACDGLEVDKNIEKISKSVQAILNSVSSSQKHEVKAWEQELTTCNHITNLKQDHSKKSTLNLKHCSDCDLNQNLWICLECGNLGCGRQQFGGIGGNGHSLQHFESTNHPVSVKLGSITPDGTADVYCYICNEERLDPQIKQHLDFWGINIATQEKTEKSLTEMQIEQNMKWDFDTSDDGKKAEILFGPGFTGFKNIGNSCYMASVLQCVFGLPEFNQRYFFPQNTVLEVAKPAEDLETQLRKIAYGIWSGRYSKPTYENGDTDPHQKGIAPSMFKAIIGKGNAEFSSMRQQDAFEFLLHFNEIVSKENRKRKADDPVKAFQFITEERIECLNCHKVRYRQLKEDNLSILVPVRKKKDNLESKNEDEVNSIKYEAVSFNELLDLYTANNKLEYHCSSCNFKSNEGAVKRTLFKTFPKTLVINANRFIIENWVPQKADVPVIVPEGPIDITKYISLGQQPGEEILPEDETDSNKDIFVPNAEALSTLSSMGFPNTRCEKALYNTGNNNAEAAMEWLFSHMDDADIDTPLVLNKNNKGKNQLFSDEQINNLMEMGFSDLQAKVALQKNSGQTEAAIEWLFSNPSDEDMKLEEPEGEDESDESGENIEDSISSSSGVFKLNSIVCHKGTSIHTGHYVAFCQRKIDGQNGESWVQYNDEKVVKGGNVDDLKKHAYIYFFTSISE